MLDQLEQLREQARTDLAAADSSDELESFRIAYLGSKGKLKQAIGWLKDAPPDQKPELGKGLNQLKRELTSEFEQKRQAMGQTQPKLHTPLPDVTQPGMPPRLGRVHILSQTMNQLIDVFARMGFDVARGPEIEDEHHNFIALNIPPEHPARDPLDNFYLDRNSQPATHDSTAATAAPPAKLLRTQTSTVQIRVMENSSPPVRVIAPGRVYRPDTHDATHTSMFHQVEGLYVDRGVTMAELKTTLFLFARAFFGEEAEIRLRPSYFPFTEPSAELDVKMQLKDRSEWIEIGGCGMVDPAVFQAVGYDPEEYTGFAFGLGVERIAMRRYRIPDIRWFFENDVRFLRQF